MTQEDQIRQGVAAIIGAVGEDPNREGLRDTPRRVAKLYREIFSGVGVDPVEAFTTVFEEEHDHSVVILKDVSFYSMCEHHLLPFFGVAQMGYIPAGKISGASKLVRALELVARRPQLQERMTSQLADAIHSALQPDGVAVVIEAEHFCMTMRGVQKPGSRILTSAVRGPFSTSDMGPSEFLALLQRR